MKPDFLSDSRSSDKTSLSEAIQTSQPLSWWLWCLTYFPELSLNDINNLVWKTYQEVAYLILNRFDFWVTNNELKDIISAAYWPQWHRSEITPVKQIWDTNLYSLHLWYGPTFAFKNIALEFLPRLLSVLARWKTINVLWASSWDTINAAHSWVKWTNIRSIFMLPSTWPSKVQRLQAVNWIVNNSNAITLLADVSFDPIQDIVKKVNSVEFKDFKEKYNITSFNSINIARILAQVVYYFRAYSELLRMWKIKASEKVIFSVPSGNFWDALAWYYAKKMWLPIEKILIATNENDMLDKFFKTWIYEPPKKDWKDFVQVTNAPSMDIAKSSNFERMLFDMYNMDDVTIKWFYDNLTKNWRFQIDKETLENIQETFISSSSTDIDRLELIKSFWAIYNHWIDPHTAASVVPWNKNEHYLQWKIPVIFLETSHVAQFASELEEKWIKVPWMDEFDSTLVTMKITNPRKWIDFIKVSWKFDDTFPIIENTIKEVFNKK